MRLEVNFFGLAWRKVSVIATICGGGVEACAAVVGTACGEACALTRRFSQVAHHGMFPVGGDEETRALFAEGWARY
ncbi:hypothetical protein KSD_00910 [Ktedonobacter sp. SOSP1-85]|nr:hypothetical protein KSD_00910 [Ktedonobacter sp. SOSP1-85]